MIKAQISPVVLVILDGWGYREEKKANAIALASLKVMNSLLETYPNTLINASGKSVGLPHGQMGNSEVGHLNIGAGRIVPQELVRISDAVEDKSIFTNEALTQICQKVKQCNSKLHLIGLCSEGGVHSHLDHLIGLLDLAQLQEISEVCIHLITDGRDTNPKDGINALAKIQAHIDQIGLGKIVTISGRYYAMDRDRRWDRVKLCYDIITQDGEIDGRSPEQIITDSYAENITDEFILPIRVASGAINAQDGVIFFNFRPDRARELCYALTSDKFDGFEREKINPLYFATFTQYDPQLNVKVAFEPQELTNILGEVISKAGLTQFRTAETEKYPHVTYFFNGGLETPFKGEDHQLIQSPMVSTYDKAPSMSAVELTQKTCEVIEKGTYAFIVINYANPDMVGHTGNLKAAIEAVETVDQCLAKLLNSIQKVGGTTLITADHGNSEYMSDENGNPWTAHTTNPVPFILIEGEGKKVVGHGGNVKLRENGKLADIAPTILEIMQLSQPKEMTGQSLLEKAEYEIKSNLNPMIMSV